MRQVQRRSWVLLAVVTVGSLVSLTMRALVPLNANDFLAGYYDQSRFEYAAVSLANHRWLGPLDKLTLAKGPSYPVFIAALHQIGLPLPVGEQLIYLLGAGAVALCVWVVTRRAIAASVVYLVLAMDPVSFSEIQAQIYRDNWYAGLSMLFVASLFLAVYGAVNRAHPAWVVLAAVVAGGSGAAFWLCREEGFWLLPSAAIIVAGVAITAQLERRRDATRPPPDRRETLIRGARLLLVLALVAAVFVAPSAYVASRNERAYGVHLVNDVTSGAFPVAYAAWTRVRGVPLRDLVPVDTAQRQAVYAVSPAARVLQPSLENAANPWKAWGCGRLGICDDFPGGALVWALRDAAVENGQFADEPTFQSFFGQLGREINAACDDGRLRCAPRLPPSLQPLLRASFGPTLRAAVHWFLQLPLNANYYKVYHRDQMFSISDADRATLRQGITGVPRTDAEAARAARRFDSYRWSYVGLGWAYRAVTLVLFALTAAGLVLGARWRGERRRNTLLRILSASLAVAIGVRLMVFGVIGTTQFPDDFRYHYPDRMMLLALLSIGAGHLVAVLYSHGPVHPSARHQALDASVVAVPDVDPHPSSIGSDRSLMR